MSLVTSWNCLHDIEQAVIVDVWFQDALRTYQLTGIQWDGIWLLQGIGWNDDRKRVFEQLYGVTIVEVELPPPFDITVFFDPDIWQEVYDFGDETDFPVDRCKCNVLGFKGNQGGSWPICWP